MIKKSNRCVNEYICQTNAYFVGYYRSHFGWSNILIYTLLSSFSFVINFNRI